MKKIVAIILLMIIIFSIISNVVMADTGVITSTTVRLRSEPNTSSDTLQLIGEGTEVEILGEENGWYRVEYDGLTGYISSDYVATQGESSSSNEGNSGMTNNVTQTPDNSTEEVPDDVQPVENTTPTTSEATEFVLSNTANLRTVPSFTSSIISTISQGTTVTVLDNLNNWVKITDGTNTGWVVRQNVDSNVTQMGNANTEIENEEVTVAVVGNVETSIENAAVTVPTSGLVNTDGSRLRASADGRVYTLLDTNTELEIIGEDGNWYIVNVGDYTNAYISKNLVNAN